MEPQRVAGVRRPAKGVLRRHIAWTWVVSAAVPLVTWLGYWAAFFPGVVNADVIRQWGQVLGARYDDWHPAFHTVTLWVLTRPWRSLGAVSLVQVCVGAALVGCTFAVLRRWGCPRALLALLVVWVAGSPAFGMNVIGVWKDGPFGLAVLGVSLLLLRVVADHALSSRLGAGLGVTLALVWLWRHNGPALVVPTVLLVACFVGRRSARGVLVAVVTCAACVALVKGPLYHALRVLHHGPKLTLQSFIHEIAGQVTAGTPLSADETTVLVDVLPLSQWRALYRCDDGNPMLFTIPIHVRRPAALLRVWLHLTARNPQALLAHWRCATRFLWSPFPTSLIIGLFGDDTVRPNDAGIEAAPLSPWLHDRLLDAVRRTLVESSVLRGVLWQPAGSLYVVLLFLAVATWRARSLAPAVVLAPAFGNTAVWLVLPFAPYLRFQWPVLLLAPVAVGLAAVDWRRLGYGGVPVVTGEEVERRDSDPMRRAAPPAGRNEAAARGWQGRAVPELVYYRRTPGSREHTMARTPGVDPRLMRTLVDKHRTLLRWLRRSHGRRFLGYLHYMEPHHRTRHPSATGRHRPLASARRSPKDA